MENSQINDTRIQETVEAFSQFNQWEERYKYLIAMGKELEAFPEEHRKEENKVKGCQSQVWLHSELKDGKIFFWGDSDASIVKGIVALLLKVYSNRTPQEIMAVPQNFIDLIGLKQHLSMSRANGLSAMMKQIQMYAIAYKTKIDLGMA